MSEPYDELDAVRKKRLPGEVVAYNPKVHPGIAYRMYVSGRRASDVAAAIGITVDVLDTWLELHPEMGQVRQRAMERDAEILKSTEDHALGRMDPETGIYSEGNPMLLKFLCQTRLGMVPASRKDTVKEQERFEGMTPGQISREAQVLRRKLARVVEIGARSGSSADAPQAGDGSQG